MMNKLGYKQYTAILVAVIIVLLIAIAIVSSMDDDSVPENTGANNSLPIEEGRLENQDEAAPISDTRSPTPDTNNGTEDKEGVPELPPSTKVVSYTGSSFAPQIITIPAGTTIRFENESATPVWPASDNHPTHRILPEFDSRGSIAPGSHYEHTFTKVGSWEYHNHLNPGETGTVVVTE